MSTDSHSGCQVGPYKPASFNTHLIRWLKARFRDVMIVAEVLHDVQYAAPWDDQHPGVRIRLPCSTDNFPHLKP
jgi:hypothetical protein